MGYKTRFKLTAIILSAFDTYTPHKIFLDF